MGYLLYTKHCARYYKTCSEKFSPSSDESRPWDHVHTKGPIGHEKSKYYKKSANKDSFQQGSLEMTPGGMGFEFET